MDHENTTTIRTRPDRLVPGDIVFNHGMVLEVPTDIGFNTTIVEFEERREAFPSDYVHLYRVESEIQ